MITELTRFTTAVGIEDYTARGGYEGARRALSLTPQEVIDEIKRSKLRGRGGAGFPTGSKWSSIAERYPRYIVANADEGEPGTFKDRFLIGRSPHLLLEGLVIGGYAVQAEKGFIYIRGEYPQEAQTLGKAIEEARAGGYLGTNILGGGFSFDIEVKRGAGSYVVGEETALLSSLMGMRGNAWYKPPYPPEEGLWGQPTIVNNVETLCCVPLIMSEGADWFRSIGTPESPGPKLYCLSGHVKRRGVYEYPMGVTVRELLDEAGIEGGFKAVQIGGTSGPIYSFEALDYKLDFENMRRVGGNPGSGAILVMNHTVSMVDVLDAITHFFADESCGRCFPCRVGTYEISKMARSIAQGTGKLEYLFVIRSTMHTMYVASFCPLGQYPQTAVGSLLDNFGGEIEVFINRQRYLRGGFDE